jgi:hypothetical protein
MSDNRSTKKLYSNKPEGLRLAGRPRKRWSDKVEQDLKQMGVRGWKRWAQNRDKWRSILKEAKVLHWPQHQGVSQSMGLSSWLKSLMCSLQGLLPMVGRWTRQAICPLRKQLWLDRRLRVEPKELELIWL